MSFGTPTSFNDIFLESNATVIWNSPTEKVLCTSKWTSTFGTHIGYPAGRGGAHLGIFISFDSVCCAYYRSMKGINP